MSFWLRIALPFVLAALKAAVKNPDSKAAMKAAFLDLFVNIKMAYPGDPDFS